MGQTVERNSKQKYFASCSFEIRSMFAKTIFEKACQHRFPSKAVIGSGRAQ